MTASVDAEKAALRSRMRSLRRAFSRDLPQAAWMAAGHVEGLLAALGLAKPGVAALYNPAGAELDPASVAETLAARGWALALPVCSAPQTAMTFRRYTPGDPLVPDGAGILSPRPGAAAAVPDLIIAPVLAFDARGHRLGQGGGYYDRTLGALGKAGVHPPVAGLAYAGQQVGAVPAEDHDQRLDAILTENGYTVFA